MFDAIIDIQSRVCVFSALTILTKWHDCINAHLCFYTARNVRQHCFVMRIRDMCPDYLNEKGIHVRTKKSCSDDDFTDVTITLRIDAETNRLLTQSAKRSKRTKRTEAEFRLTDHVKRWKSISEIGVTTPLL
ncbi:MAG: TraY domain-containing protein [Plesiomonas shigelloides]